MLWTKYFDLTHLYCNMQRRVEDELLNVTNLLQHSNKYPLYTANQMLDDKQRMEFDLSQVQFWYSLFPLFYECISSSFGKLFWESD